VQQRKEAWDEQTIARTREDEAWHLETPHLARVRCGELHGPHVDLTNLSL